MEMHNVGVDDNVSTDLRQADEAVFEVIALNPDASLEEVRSRYDMSSNKVVEVTDVLQEKGLIRALEEDEYNDCLWEVTDLGRLMLLKYSQVMRFDVMEAKLRGQPREQVDLLEDKKQGFETAYRQCKALFEGGDDL